MGNRNVNGCDVIAESGNFLLVNASAHTLYPRKKSNYKVMAQFSVVNGEWRVSFLTWIQYRMVDIQSVAGAILMFMGTPALVDGYNLTLIEIKETSPNE